MSENKDDQPREVPLVELLDAIPSDVRLMWEDKDGVKAWHSMPIGLYAQKATSLIRSQSSTIESLRRELDAVRQQTPSKDWCNRPDLNFVRHVNGAISEKCPKCQRYSPECASPVLCHYDSISKARGRE